jgi:metallophosphoesterase (TIGR00282 family)
MLGDVIGNAGIEALETGLNGLKERFCASFVVVNGENAADGFGLTEPLAQRIFAAGADVISSGNHIWEKRDFWDYLNGDNAVLRPANYPPLPTVPGKGFISIQKEGIDYLVINLQGRRDLYNIDCPFRTFDLIYCGEAEAACKDKAAPKPLVLVDFHAESNWEKEAMGFYADGRAAAVCGTHTHIQTADEKILPNGTAYISDLGMTGVCESVIGMDKDICVMRSKASVLYKMECAKGPACIHGVNIVIGSDGKALSIERIAL